MSLQARIASVLDRARLVDLFCVQAEDDHAFFIDDRHLGAVSVGLPVPGGADRIVDAIKAILMTEMPPGTIVNFSLFSSPNIDNTISFYSNRRIGSTTSNVLERLSDQFASHFRDHAEISPFGEGYAPVNETEVIFWLKVPLSSVSDLPAESELDAFKLLNDRCLEAMQNAGLPLSRLNERNFIMLMRSLLNPFGPIDTSYNEEIPTREQIAGPGAYFSLPDAKSIVIDDDVHAKVLSMRRLPRKMGVEMMNYMIGDPLGLTNQISCPYLISTTIQFPKIGEKRSAIERRSHAINYQVFGPMAKWMPKLAAKKKGIDIMVEQLTNHGEVPVEMNTTMILYGRSKKEVNRQSGSLVSYFERFQFGFAEDKRIHGVMFLNAMPLFATTETTQNTHRYWTMGLKHALQFIPIIGDWRGTCDPDTGAPGSASLFLTRRSQAVFFDLFNGSRNYNFVISGDTGGGKSFTGQVIALNEASLGTKVWVFDLGYSYSKVAHVIGGEVIDVNVESGLCFNPFTLVESLQEDMESLKSMLAVMASPNEILPHDQLLLIEEAIKSCWERFGTQTTPHDIYDYLNQQDKPNAQDLALRFFPWSAAGQYDRLVNGVNNICFNKDFVVLELEGVSSNPHLRLVITLMLAQRIQTETFKKDKSRRKLVMFEEAWKLLKDESGNGYIGKFIEELYRRIRKENGAVGVITQNLFDMCQDVSGMAMLSAAEWKILMPQSQASINYIRSENVLPLDDYGLDLLKSLRAVPPKFSEALILNNETYGVARVTVDKWISAMMSSKGAARNEILDAISNGVDPVQAVDEFIQRQADRNNNLPTYQEEEAYV